MLLFLLGCLISGDIDKDKIDIQIDSVKLKAVTVIDDSSQKSSLKIVMTTGGEILGHGSGNYFKLGKYRFVLTAAHVALSDYDLRLMDGEEMVEATLIFADKERDIAILAPKSELKSIAAKRWKVNDDDDLIGEVVTYSGYPSGLDKVLIRGMVSAHREGEILIQSFALPGSSGSVVFDSHGRVLGVVSAIMLHQSQFSPFPHLQEDMVYIASADFITKKFLKEVFQCGGE
jgi:S1-C subfamily serine protease